MNKVLLLGGTGLVGKAIYKALQDDYRIVITAGHQDIDGGWRLAAEESERLLSILNKEDPDIVISSMRGEFRAQLEFHTVLANWLAGRDKRLLFISTANVFDGDLSRPHTEMDSPVPDSAYGIYKRDCEVLLQDRLLDQLIILRPSAVWSQGCPRLSKLRECSRTGEAIPANRGTVINITLAEQIGWYVKYVLDENLTGVFHVGTTDTVDYFEFQKMVCETVGIQLPQFVYESENEVAFQAVIPMQRSIPENLQLTVAQVLHALKGTN